MKSMPKQPDWFEPAHGGAQLCLLPVLPLVTGLGGKGAIPDLDGCAGGESAPNWKTLLFVRLPFPLGFDGDASAIHMWISIGPRSLLLGICVR